jgi:hypothetical protein
LLSFNLIRLFWIHGNPAEYSVEGYGELTPWMQRLVSLKFTVASPLFKMLFYPSLFSPCVVGLYVSSGFLLKAARRFDLGFDCSTGTSTSRKSRCKVSVS